MNNILDRFSSHEDCSFNDSGDMFAVVSEHKYISIIMAPKHFEEKNIKNFKYMCSKVRFHPGGTRIYLNSFHESDHKARLLDIQGESFIRYFPGHQSQINSLCVHEKCLITSSEDKTVRFYDENEEKETFTLQYNSSPKISLHPNGNCLIVATNSQINMYDRRQISSGVVASTKVDISDNNEPVFGMLGTSFAFNGGRYFSVYGLADLKERYSFSFKEEIYGPLCYSPEEQFLLVGIGKDIVVFDNENGDQVNVLKGASSNLTSIAFSPKYCNMITTGNQCQIWTVDQNVYHFWFDE